MDRSDESLIRDADLLAKVAELRGKGTHPRLLDTFIGVQIEKQQERDAKAAAEAEKAVRLAAMKPLARRRESVREVIENEPASPESLHYIHSVLALCGLPYRRLPASERSFERKNGRMALVVHAGELRSPMGERVPQPLPFGPKARLLLAHLSSEAKRNNSPTVEIADSLSGFMREMGLEVRGGPRGTIQPFKDQVNALAACRMELSAWDGHRSSRSIDAKLFNKVDIWLSNNPAEQILWPTTISFSSDFFESLKQRAMPVNVHVLRHLATSARKLDIYFWFNYRLNSIEYPLKLSWQSLGEQFGDGFARERDFKAHFAADLADIRELFPKLPVRLTEQGLVLEPAEPTVLGIPSPRLEKKSS